MGITIETITVTRPMKVIAYTLCFITTLLLVTAVASTEWIMTDGWREGVFTMCVKAGAPTPLPFGTKEIPGCYPHHEAGYIRATAALVIVGIIFDFFGTLLTGLGLRSTDPNKKYKYYRVAIYALFVCSVVLLAALIIYPVNFSKELQTDKGQVYNGRLLNEIRGSLDFDGDGILDINDNDDDNDGKLDQDDNDWDNDGIANDRDDDDDNDGIKDVDESKWVPGSHNPEIVFDSDNDGIPDSEDDDDDNDGTPDAEDDDDADMDNDGIPDAFDNDDDGDGIDDAIDNDDDNDGITDDMEDSDGDGILDGDEKVDQDGDGTPDDEDNDDDNDGIPDDQDNDDDNDGIPDASEKIDTDGDGIPDDQDLDDDNDGLMDAEDPDDDNDGIPDEYDISGTKRAWTFGYGYAMTWVCFLCVFLSFVLMVCDRESEEIFYKEREVDDEEEEEDA